MIYGFVPWADVMDTIFGAEWPLPTFETFYFAEASVVFIVAAVIIGLIGRLGEEGTVNAIVAGAGEFLGAALIIVLARAVTVVMKDACDHRHDHPLDRRRGERRRSAHSSGRWHSWSTCRSPSSCPRRRDTRR